MGVAIDHYSYGALGLFGMNFVISPINLAGGSENPGIQKYRWSI
jgi:hypothetical protein